MQILFSELDVMASAAADGSELPQIAVCPSCKEEIDREDESSFPDTCYFCEETLPEGLGVNTCPSCGRHRLRGKTGKLAARCPCSYRFKTQTAFQTGTPKQKFLWIKLCTHFNACKDLYNINFTITDYTQSSPYACQAAV